MYSRSECMSHVSNYLSFKVRGENTWAMPVTVFFVLFFFLYFTSFCSLLLLTLNSSKSHSVTRQYKCSFLFKVNTNSSPELSISNNLTYCKPGIAFQKETSHLIFSASQVAGFYMKYNTGWNILSDHY